MQDIEKILEAVLLVETNGTKSFHTVVNLVGKDVANAIMISHMRHNLTSAPHLKYTKRDPKTNILILETLKVLNLK